MKNENQETNAIATIENQNQMPVVQGNQTLTPEMLALIQDLQQSTAEIEGLQVEYTKPSDMVKDEIVFNLVDAYISEIQDNGQPKDVVIFRCECADGIERFVMQSHNPIRGKYANMFSTAKALGAVTGQPVPALENFHFVEDERYSKNGNSAIVLRQVPKQLKAKTK